MIDMLARLRKRPASGGAAPDPFAAATSRAASEDRLAIFDYPYRPRARDWSAQPGFSALCAMFEREGAAIGALLQEIATMDAFFATIPIHQGDPASPHWLNDFVTAFDAMSLCALVKKLAPRNYMEVGSGNSTKFVRATIRYFDLPTRIVSIDPMPRAEVNTLCDEVIRHGLESADLAVFGQLSAGDVLFVDNSHRSFPNSDVTVFFTEVLPSLPKGLIWGVHDIFLPDDYPQAWNDEKRYYNEQYLMMMYLLGGSGRDRVLMPNAYVAQHTSMLQALNPLWSHPKLKGVQAYGCAFWMLRER